MTDITMDASVGRLTGIGSHQTIVGENVPVSDEDGVIRIGRGELYLEIKPDGQVRINGTKEIDETIEAVLHGIEIVIALNPYYRK